jgi:transcriptional regulator with XRE-family HTH domain
MKHKNIIERIRKQTLLTQAEIAAKANLSIKSIGNYEGGKKPRKLELYKLMAAFPDVFNSARS